MFFLAATLVGWIGGDFVYRKVAAENILQVELTTGNESVPKLIINDVIELFLKLQSAFR